MTPLPAQTTVLLVEDEVSSRLLVAELLKEVGYLVTEAESGEQALELLSTFTPDIIVTDWVMPGISGIELIKKVRQFEIAQPYILVLTAQSDEAHLIEAFDAEANDFINKPIKPRVLLARVNAGAKIQSLKIASIQQLQELKAIAEELSISNKKLQELSVTDVLTGCPNRRYAVERLKQEWSGSERRHSNLSCLVVDIDWFKEVNDLYGHDRGDEVLKLISDTLVTKVREGDVVCRVGGDEFWIICPGSDLASATACAIRLCKSVDNLKIPAGDKQCSISIGAAVRLNSMNSFSELVEAADQSLYQAKRAGKGRIHSSETQT